MKKFLQIFGITTAIAVLIGMQEGGNEFAIYFGLGCMGLGVLNIFIGLLMLIPADKKWAGPFMLAGLLQILIGFGSCSARL